jgi:hypothetical protein
MQWEYDLEVGSFEEWHDLIDKLNQLGGQGWEAVGLATDAEGEHFSILLKRKKSRATKPMKASRSANAG